MIAEQSDALEQSQRVQVETESHPSGKRVKIRLENYAEQLGWYTSGSLTLPLHQLPLLEQAVAEMRARKFAAEENEIIPFPGC
jgi:hypothetical protein